VDVGDAVPIRRPCRRGDFAGDVVSVVERSQFIPYRRQRRSRQQHVMVLSKRIGVNQGAVGDVDQHTTAFFSTLLLHLSLPPIPRTALASPFSAPHNLLNCTRFSCAGKSPLTAPHSAAPGPAWARSGVAGPTRRDQALPAGPEADRRDRQRLRPGSAVRGGVHPLRRIDTLSDDEVGAQPPDRAPGAECSREGAEGLHGGEGAQVRLPGGILCS